MLTWYFMNLYMLLKKLSLTFQIRSHNGARVMKLVMINIITYTSKTTRK
jgi:hypothetical protein